VRVALKNGTTIDNARIFLAPNACVLYSVQCPRTRRGSPGVRIDRAERQRWLRGFGARDPTHRITTNHRPPLGRVPVPQRSKQSVQSLQAFAVSWQDETFNSQPLKTKKPLCDARPSSPLPGAIQENSRRARAKNSSGVAAGRFVAIPEKTGAGANIDHNGALPLLRGEEARNRDSPRGDLLHSRSQIFVRAVAKSDPAAYRGWSRTVRDDLIISGSSRPSAGSARYSTVRPTTGCRFFKNISAGRTVESWRTISIIAFAKTQIELVIGFAPPD